MGFIIHSTDVTDMKVYLTDLGRTLLLNQGFVPSSFSISDEDVNYTVTTTLTQQSGDLTGDYADNLYSISPNIKIKTNIIR